MSSFTIINLVSGSYDVHGVGRSHIRKRNTRRRTNFRRHLWAAWVEINEMKIIVNAVFVWKNQVIFIAQFDSSV